MVMHLYMYTYIYIYDIYRDIYIYVYTCTYVFMCLLYGLFVQAPGIGIGSMEVWRRDSSGRAGGSH